MPGFWADEEGAGNGIWVISTIALAALLLIVINPWNNPTPGPYICTDCAIAYSAWPPTYQGGGFPNVMVVEAPLSVANPPTHLTTPSDRDYQPAWSPDGSKIAFVTDRDDPASFDYEVYVMDADGGNQINLTNNPAFDSEPAWSPDGSKMVFMSNRDSGFPPHPNNPTNIYVMDADGSNVVRLTTGDIWDRYPAWSPDGTRIAFTSKRQVVNATDLSVALDFEIWLMDPDGSNMTLLTQNDTNDFMPDWSPDGSQITYVNGFSTNGEIWVMDADGGNAKQLTFNSARDMFPDWSPDGTEIAFSTDRDLGNQHYALYVMNANGTNQRYVPIAAFPDAEKWPDWRPVTTSTAFSVIPPPPVILAPLAATTTSTAPVTTSTTTPVTTTDPVGTTVPPPTTTTVAACTPAPPVLLRPVDESVVAARAPTLAWAYRQQPCVISQQTLELAMDETFTDEVLSVSVGPEATNWVPESDLMDCVTYYWRVAPVVDGLMGPYSDVSSFDTVFPKAIACP